MIKALNILMAAIAAALVLALYIAKTEAGKAEDRLANMQAELAQERGRINALRVDVQHLEDPEQLRVLARAYLGFEPVKPSQEVALSDLPSAEAGEEGEEDRSDPRAGVPEVRRTGGRP